MSPTADRAEHLALDDAALEAALRAFPDALEELQRTYAGLEQRAAHVERELVRTNDELESRIAELDALQRHLEAVVESLPCGVIERNAAGEIVRVNGTAQDLLGLTEDLLVGHDDHGDLPAPTPDGTPVEQRCADGRRRTLASHTATVRQADGTVAGTVQILEDHTERAALAERLHAADKMAALGTVSAGIAHEIRNPLNAVQGFAALLLRGLEAHGEPRERLAPWAEHIVAGASEMDAIVESMLSFGSPERLRLEPIEGSALLEEAMAAAFAGQPDQGGLRLELEASTPPFLGDGIQLRQALRNLLANAACAQPKGGAIRLTLEHEREWVVARVSDAGPGVAPELRTRVLDPFFTTRPEGTGLGLALVSTIARLHGGEVELSPDPSPLGGAEFLLRIPFRPTSRPGDSSFPVEH